MRIAQLDLSATGRRAGAGTSIALYFAPLCARVVVLTCCCTDYFTAVHPAPTSSCLCVATLTCGRFRGHWMHLQVNKAFGQSQDAQNRVINANCDGRRGARPAASARRRSKYTVSTLSRTMHAKSWTATASSSTLRANRGSSTLSFLWPPRH